MHRNIFSVPIFKVPLSYKRLLDEFSIFFFFFNYMIDVYYYFTSKLIILETNYL